MLTITLPEGFAAAPVMAALLGRPARFDGARFDGARLDGAEAVTPAEAERVAFCLRAFGRDAAAPTQAGFGLPEPVILAEMVAEILSLKGRLAAEEIVPRLPQVMARAVARLRGRANGPPARLRRPWNEQDVVAETVERPHVGYFAIEHHRLRHRRFDGSLSPPLERMVFASGDAVTVLPYDPLRDAVLLIEQFRAGPHARADRVPWCLEAIAGRCDAAEELEETVRREAREEAGLALGRLERVLAYYPTPAIAAEHITSFVGEADLAAAEGGLFGLDAEHEDIRAFVVARAEAEAALRAGEINNAPLGISLLWLALHAERLRRAWSG